MAMASRSPGGLWRQGFKSILRTPCHATTTTWHTCASGRLLVYDRAQGAEPLPAPCGTAAVTLPTSDQPWSRSLVLIATKDECIWKAPTRICLQPLRNDGPIEVPQAFTFQITSSEALPAPLLREYVKTAPHKNWWWAAPKIVDACRDVQNCEATSQADKELILQKIYDIDAFNLKLQQLVFSSDGLFSGWVDGRERSRQVGLIWRRSLCRLKGLKDSSSGCLLPKRLESDDGWLDSASESPSSPASEG